MLLICHSHLHLYSSQRPAWSTGILIPASFLCGVIAAVLIWRGGQYTKRTKEVKERIWQALAADYITCTERTFHDVAGMEGHECLRQEEMAL